MLDCSEYGIQSVKELVRQWKNRVGTENGDGSLSPAAADSLVFFLEAQWLAANQPAPLISFSVASLEYCKTFSILK